MPPALSLIPTILGVCLVSALLLWWGRLPATWRRTLSLGTSGAGVGFLILAMSTEGLRESPTETVFLVGAPLVTGQASASAGLPYYVLTGLCLLLGTAGLAAGDERARALGRRWLATAIALSILVTLVRLALEKAAAPLHWTRPVGVVWLAPVVGAFFALSLRAEGKGVRSLLGALALYALAVRGFLAGLYLLASHLRLGSHYDVSALVRVRNPLTHRIHEFLPGSFEQMLSLVLIPQLVAWPLFTLAAGLLGAGVALLVASNWRSPRVPTVHPDVGMAAAGKGR